MAPDGEAHFAVHLISRSMLTHPDSPTLTRDRATDVRSSRLHHFRECWKSRKEALRG